MKYIRNFIIIVFMLLIFTSCVVTPPAISEARVIEQDSFGICHAGRRGHEERDILASLGISMVRLDISWKLVESEPGDFDFSYFDLTMQKAREAGVKVLAVLGFDTPWLHEYPENVRQIDPEDLPKWLRFVEAAVTRYGNEVVAYEIWNEPNYNTFWTGTDEDFFYLTTETVKTINRIAPDVTVLVGSVILHPIRLGRSYFRRFLASGAADGADGISVHTYGMSSAEAGRRIINARKDMDTYGIQGKIWLTETGIPTGGAYPYAILPERQGSFTVKWLIRQYAAGADKLIWYELYDLHLPGEAPKNTSSEAFFGVAYRNLELKTGGKAMRHLMPELLGSRWAPELAKEETDKSVFYTLYTFKKNDSSAIAIVWSNIFKRKITITGFPRGATLYETATSQERQLQPGEIFTLGPDPIIVSGYSTGDISITKGRK